MMTFSISQVLPFKSRANFVKTHNALFLLHKYKFIQLSTWHFINIHTIIWSN